MTISNVSTSQMLSSLLAELQGQSQSGASQTSASSLLASLQTESTSGLGSTPAYQLSLGQHAQQGLVGYGQLGQLIGKAETALDGMDSANPAATATFGNGQSLQQSYNIDVQQLAQAQVVVSGSYASADQSVIATGTLSIQIGSGDPVTVAITDGSLNGVATAINSASAGITATVTQAASGYELQLTGQTGAANAFAVSGIDALSFDPSAPSFTGLQDTQAAQDARYSVDGGTVETSASNTNAQVANGVTTTLTATGTTTVSVPFGYTQAAGAAQTLVDSVNTLVGQLGELTGTGGSLSSDNGMASKLAGVIDQALGQSFGNLGSLSDIGLTVQKDGTLAIDQSKLLSAYTSNPTGTRQLLDAAAGAVKSVLGGTSGAEGAVKDQMKTLVNDLMAQMPSLAQVLGGSSSSSSSSGNSMSSLAALLNNGTVSGSSSTASGTANSASSLASLLNNGTISGNSASGASSNNMMAALDRALSNTSGSGSTSSSALAAIEASLAAGGAGGTSA